MSKFMPDDEIKTIHSYHSNNQKSCFNIFHYFSPLLFLLSEEAAPHQLAHQTWRVCEQNNPGGTSGSSPFPSRTLDESSAARSYCSSSQPLYPHFVDLVLSERKVLVVTSYLAPALLMLFECLDNPPDKVLREVTEN